MINGHKDDERSTPYPRVREQPSRREAMRPRNCDRIAATGALPQADKLPRAAKLPQAPEVPQAPRLADDDRKRRGDPGSPGTSVISKTKPQTKRPSLYRVLLLNDDYTPME